MLQLDRKLKYRCLPLEVNRRRSDMEEEQGFDLNDFLKKMQLESSVSAYDYGTRMPLVSEGVVTLFSGERRRMRERQSHFELFSSDGRYYFAHDLDQGHLQNVLVDILNTDTLPDPIEPYNPDFNFVMQLIKWVAPMGYSVVGVHQEPYDAWDVLADDALLGVLFEEREDEGPAPMIVESEGGSKFMVDQNDVPFMYRTKVGSKIMLDQEAYYSVLDRSGQALFRDLTKKMLIPVLWSLLLGVDIFAIKALFCYPNLSADLLAEADVTLYRNYCSEPRVVQSAADLRDIEHLPVVKDEPHLDSSYRFHGYEGQGTYGGQIPNDDMLTVMNWMRRDQPLEFAATDRRLTEWVLALASSQGLSIDRYLRRQVSFALVHDFEVADSNIVGVNARERLPRLRYPIISVFDVIDDQDETLVQTDLPFDELLTYLIQAAPEKAVEMLKTQP